MRELGVVRRLDPLPSLTQQAYQAIREAITSLELPPGAAVSENTLAEQLGVSRSPTRQALKLLEHEGMVITLPQRGTFTTKIREEDARDAVVMRRLLEAWALGEMQAKGVRPDLDELRRLLDAQAEAAASGEYMAFLELDTTFHAAILAAAGNQKAVELFDQLNVSLLRVRSWTLRRPKPLGAGVDEHRAIYNAISQGDWETAKTLLLGADDELLQALTRMRRDEPDLFG